MCKSIFLICGLLLTLAAGAEPRHPRDYFKLLPTQYFRVLSGSKDEFLKRHVLVDDPGNGYLSAGGEAGQDGFVMALFKRPDGSHFIGLSTSGEMWDNSYMLQYAGGKWRDVSIQVIPEYSKDKVYRFPRHGTTVPVEQLKMDDGALVPTGKILYKLAWSNGKFKIIH